MQPQALETLETISTDDAAIQFAAAALIEADATQQLNIKTMGYPADTIQSVVTDLYAYAQNALPGTSVEALGDYLSDMAEEFAGRTKAMPLKMSVAVTDVKPEMAEDGSTFVIAINGNGKSADNFAEMGRTLEINGSKTTTIKPPEATFKLFGQNIKYLTVVFETPNFSDLQGQIFQMALDAGLDMNAAMELAEAMEGVEMTPEIEALLETLQDLTSTLEQLNSLANDDPAAEAALQDRITALTEQLTTQLEHGLSTGALPQAFVDFIGQVTQNLAVQTPAFAQSLMQTLAARPALSQALVDAGQTIGTLGVLAVENPAVQDLSAEQVQQLFQTIEALSAQGYSAAQIQSFSAEQLQTTMAGTNAPGINTINPATAALGAGLTAIGLSGTGNTRNTSSPSKSATASQAKPATSNTAQKTVQKALITKVDAAAANANKPSVQHTSVIKQSNSGSGISHSDISQGNTTIKSVPTHMAQPTLQPQKQPTIETPKPSAPDQSPPNVKPIDKVPDKDIKIRKEPEQKPTGHDHGNGCPCGSDFDTASNPPSVAEIKVIKELFTDAEIEAAGGVENLVRLRRFVESKVDKELVKRLGLKRAVELVRAEENSPLNGVPNNTPPVPGHSPPVVAGGETQDQYIREHLQNKQDSPRDSFNDAGCPLHGKGCPGHDDEGTVAKKLKNAASSDNTTNVEFKGRKKERRSSPKPQAA